ncbi:MAG: 3-hydroxyacyl-ACP dehydratase FabZ [Gammaproteobacteria bacterium]
MSIMNIHEVMKRLPHRYPFLLIDRVLECVPGKSVRALKNVTINEPFFVGHFPQRPVMPGVLILEALAQTTGILAMASTDQERRDNSLYYFVGIDKARFKRPVEPGDQLILEAALTRSKRGIWMFATEAKVDGTVVACADLMCTARDFEP